MTDIIEQSPELFTERAPIEALAADISTAEKAAALAHLRQRVEKNRVSLLEHARKFNEMYERAGRELSVEGLIQLAERVHESEKGAAERLDPWIRALRQALAAPSQEGRQHIQELLEISAAWLDIYHDTRARLLNLAAERRGGTREVLCARPVEGDIDHEALSREFMARFPKIRAALAK